MTTQTRATSNKKLLDVQIETIHSDSGIKAFKVRIKEGKFIVVDYKDRFAKNPDTEIFWEHGMVQLAPHFSEYKAATKVVTDHLKGK